MSLKKIIDQLKENETASSHKHEMDPLGPVPEKVPGTELLLEGFKDFQYNGSVIPRDLLFRYALSKNTSEQVQSQFKEFYAKFDLQQEELFNRILNAAKTTKDDSGFEALLSRKIEIMLRIVNGQVHG